MLAILLSAENRASKILHYYREQKETEKQKELLKYFILPELAFLNEHLNLADRKIFSEKYFVKLLFSCFDDKDDDEGEK